MKLIYKILGGILLLAIFAAFLFSLYKGNIEKSNLTDWISAFCNLAMAAAALGGYLIAKDWKRHAVKDKVLSLALEIKVNDSNKIFDCLMEIGKIIDRFEFLYKYFIDKNEPTDDFLKHLNDYSKELKINVTKLKDVSFTFYQNHTQIRSLGYDYKKDLDISIYELEHELSILSFNLKSFLENFTYFLNFESMGFTPEGNEQLIFDGFKNENNLSTSLKISHEIERQTHQLYIFAAKSGSVLNDIEYTG